MRRLSGMVLVAVSVFILGSCSTVGDALGVALAAEMGKPKPEGTDRPKDAPPQAKVSHFKGKPLDNKVFEARLKAGPGDRKVAAGADLSQKKPGAFELQNGGWALYRVTKGKDVSLFSMATFRDKDLWVYEIVSYDKGKANAVQMVYKGFEKIAETGRADAAELVEMWTMDQEGELTRLDRSMTGMMAGAYTRSLNAPEGAALVPGGSVTVPYGTFASTWLGTDAKAKTKAWIHTGAPFFHLVKSVSDGDSTVMELADGGSTGYQSVMPSLAERANWTDD